MNTTASAQLESIQSMMASGHRSVRMEKHTLLLWGIGAALLIAFVDLIFSKELFPETWVRSLWANLFISIVLIGIGIWDYRLTRLARQKRDETVSFVQQQLTKVWWMLVGLIVLFNIGYNFFGGGYIFYSVAIMIIGLAFYIQGLFSQQMLAWAGIMMMIVGPLAVALQLPYFTTKWLACFVFGFGFPYLAFVIDKVNSDSTFNKRIGYSAVWLLVVLIPTIIADKVNTQFAIPDRPAIELGAYLQQPGPVHGNHVVRLPAGTTIPVEVEFTGDLINTRVKTVLALSLQTAVDISLTDGEPDGRFRIGDNEWTDSLYGMSARSVDFDAGITPENGIQIKMKNEIWIKK